MEELSHEAIKQRLLALGVATTHEARGRRGLLDGIRLVSGPPVAGPAATAWIPAGDNLGVHHALATASPGAVLVIASWGRGGFGPIGELIVTSARALGVAGIVIDDGVRDITEFDGDVSVAATGVCSRGTVKRRHLSLGAPAVLGGTWVESGDWVVGDADGICVVPQSEIENTLRAGEQRVQKEGVLRSALIEGVTTLEALSLQGVASRATAQ